MNAMAIQDSHGGWESSEGWTSQECAGKLI